LRRISAILLLALFSFSLIGFAFQSDPDANLPACCRRSGNHHCSLASHRKSFGVGFNANAQCPLFPSFAVATATGTALRLTPRVAVVAPDSVSLFVPRVHAASRQGRFVSAHGERGPPFFLLNS
jgi:hypothetical protein